MIFHLTKRSGMTGLTWAKDTRNGNGTITLAFSISADTTKSYVFYVTSEIESGHATCIAKIAGMELLVNGAKYPSSGDSIRAARDSSGTARQPSFSRTATKLTLTASSAAPFAADVTYCLHYAEFDSV